MSVLQRRSSSPVRRPERRRAGTRLRAELERQRRAAWRLETTGRVAVEVARDVDKLATAVIASVHALSQELVRQEELLPQLNEIRIAGERTVALARQLLAMGEPAPLRLVVVELDQVIEGLSGLLRPLLGDDIELEVVPAREPCRTRVDLGQLEALVISLAASCLDAMPDGGRLRIGASMQLIGAGESAADLPSGNYAVLSVIRHSAGVDDDELPQTFEPGSSWTTRGRGAGLDEASIAELAAECGAYLVVDSDAVRGTSRVYLPSTDEPVSSAAQGVSAVLPGGFETVLLVDDDRVSRMCVRHILRARGYRVIEAASARQALSVSKRHTGRIAALVTSVVLNDMNGYGLAERLRAQRPDLKLLFMTSYLGRTEDAGIRLVGTEVVLKPFTAATLSRALRAVLDAGT